MDSFSQKSMNLVLRRLADFLALRISGYVLIALLAVFFLYFALSGHGTVVPLYVILVLALFPYLSEQALTVRKKENYAIQPAKKGEPSPDPLPFPLLRQKYRFSSLRLSTLRFTFLLALFLLLCWHLRSQSYPTGNALQDRLPALLIAVGVAVRVLCAIGYRIYFHFFLSSAVR